MDNENSKQDPDPGSGAANHVCNDNQLDKLTEKVFQSPEILKVILMHNLRKSGDSRGSGYLCTREARRLRLVSKTWLLEINYIFQRQGKPLVFLGGKNLKQFLEICDIKRWGIPPISLSIETKTLLCRNFCEDLDKVFRTDILVAKLISLRITADPYALKEIGEVGIGDTVICLPTLASHFKFANLRKVWLKQAEHSFTEVVEQERVEIPRLEEFVQKIFDQSEYLEEFNFEGNVWQECPPGQLGGLTLPVNVTRVRLDTRVNVTRMLEVHGGRILEGITTLKLNVTTRHVFNVKEMERVLEGVRMSLEYFELSFRHEALAILVDPPPDVVVKIPVMEKLRKMKIGGTLFRMDRAQVLNRFGDRFPQLEDLELYDYTAELLLNDWCDDSSVFGGVTTLTLKLDKEELSEDKMQKILNSFPNVEKLWISCIDAYHKEGVRYIFRKLGGQLKSLHLDLRGFLHSEEEMDEILIGGNVEIVRRLKMERRDGKLWADFLEGGFESLRDLVNLEEFELVVYNMRWRVENGLFRRLMGRQLGLCFKFGCEIWFEGVFMRMPKLRRLKLKGWVDPEKELVEMWKEQGRRNGLVREVEVESDKISESRDRMWLSGKLRWMLVYSVVVIICLGVFGRVIWDSESGEKIAENQVPKNNLSGRFDL